MIRSCYQRTALVYAGAFAVLQLLQFQSAVRPAQLLMASCETAKVLQDSSAIYAHIDVIHDNYS